MKVGELGQRQTVALDALKKHGSWYPGAGWILNTHSGTVKMLESLVRRGLVVKTPQNRRGDKYVLATVENLTSALDDLNPRVDALLRAENLLDNAVAAFDLAEKDQDWSDAHRNARRSLAEVRQRVTSEVKQQHAFAKQLGVLELKEEV